MNSILKITSLLTLLAGISFPGSAQREAPDGWHLSDQKTSGYYGISLDKAYQFLKGKKSQEVVVAIIDSGIDTTHEDLKPVLWTNPKEIPGNGVDDDKNGYIDDVHGWNFLGGKDGRNVEKDSYEAARVYHRYKAKFQNIKDASSLSKEDQDLYKMWLKAAGDLKVDPTNALNLMLTANAYKGAKAADTILQRVLGKKEFSASEVEGAVITTAEGKSARNKFLYLYQGLDLDKSRTNKDVLTEVGDYVESEEKKANGIQTPPQNYRGDIVKDNESDINDRSYGNNDIMASGAEHGTHVSGIIGASRNNGKGVNGVADNVRIMMLRAVPDGDEHDKDIALAIRYAVDNGAKVINMSFGKGVSPEKQWVDDAVRYAESKGVLLVRAAGNENTDIDSAWSYPSTTFKDGKRPTNWVVVGASGASKNDLVAYFSNYGKEDVDVFSPGVNIYSSVPGGNTYRNLSGTSMASPVVTGLAALIMEYYPTLTPQQVKLVLEKSAVVYNDKVISPGTGEKVKLSELSKTGGIINAYEAVKLAAEVSKGGVVKSDEKIKPGSKESKPKSKTPVVKKKQKVIAA